MAAKKWAEAELATLDKMRLEGISSRDIAERLGRTHKSIVAKIDWLHLTPEMKKRRYEAESRRRQGIKGITRSEQSGYFPNIQTPEQVIDDRNRRGMLRPRDLTAAFCGDPLPGYSALERRT